jgi:hypothetical protein
MNPLVISGCFVFLLASLVVIRSATKNISEVKNSDILLQFILILLWLLLTEIPKFK